jgi:hypothetical protein
MTQNNNTFLSLTDLISGKNWNNGSPVTLVIPRLQRPYAQGRQEVEHIRKAFIKEIFEALSHGSDLKLNFIYGTLKENGDFEVLDGQQRLTTLFLLYTYIHIREKKELPNCLKNNEKVALRYETRQTTQKFIEKLTELETLSELTTQKEGDNNTPSAYLKKQIWFTEALRLDSSVQGMIVMLDAIHEQYEQYKQNNQNSNSLNGNLKNLHFLALQLENFNLTEELYVKMNARGLPLTSFEKFKADLVGYLKDKNKDTERDWLEFTSKLDAEWIDIFWKSGKEDLEVSNRYFRFFFRSTTILSLIVKDTLDKKNKDKDIDISFFQERSEEQTPDKSTKVVPYFGFEHYKELFDILYKQQNNNLSPIANPLVNFTKLLTVLKELPLTAPWGDSLKLFDEQKDYTFKTAAVFAGFLLYVLYQPFSNTQSGEDNAFNLPKDDFNKWMRIVWRISENTVLDKKDSLFALIRLFFGVITENENDISAKIKAYSPKNNKAFQEEVEKINIDQEELVEIDKHKFFKGFAAPILNESSFVANHQHLLDCFSKEGIQSDSDHIIMRAALAAIFVEHFKGNSTIFNKKNPILNERLAITEKAGDNLYLKSLLRHEEVISILQAAMASNENGSFIHKLEEKLKEKICEMRGQLKQLLNSQQTQQTKQLQACLPLCTDSRLLNWINSISTDAKPVRLKFTNEGRVLLHLSNSHTIKLYLDDHRSDIINDLMRKGFDLAEPLSESQKNALKTGRYLGEQPIRLNWSVNGEPMIAEVTIDDEVYFETKEQKDEFLNSVQPSPSASWEIASDNKKYSANIIYVKCIHPSDEQAIVPKPNVKEVE